MGSIHIINKSWKPYPFHGQARHIHAWIKHIVALESPEAKIEELQVNWISDKALLTINREALDHDYYTDIITFDHALHDQQGRITVLSGELYISVERLTENAKELGVPIKEEALRLIAHGILHILGYKDKTEAEQLAMRTAEAKHLAHIRHLIVD